MRYEPATEDDKDYFRALNRACYEDVIVRQFGLWDVVSQNKSFETKWPTNNFRKVFVEDNLVGGVWIDEHPEFIQLREVQIHPNFQGKGIGTELVKMEIESARRKGKPLRLRVLFQNQAIRLYERLGFVIIDENEYQHIMECS